MASVHVLQLFIPQVRIFQRFLHSQSHPWFIHSYGHILSLSLSFSFCFVLSSETLRLFYVWKFIEDVSYCICIFVHSIRKYICYGDSWHGSELWDADTVVRSLGSADSQHGGTQPGLWRQCLFLTIPYLLIATVRRRLLPELLLWCTSFQIFLTLPCFLHLLHLYSDA